MVPSHSDVQDILIGAANSGPGDVMTKVCGERRGCGERRAFVDHFVLLRVTCRRTVRGVGCSHTVLTKYGHLVVAELYHSHVCFYSSSHTLICSCSVPPGRGPGL